MHYKLLNFYGSSFAKVLGDMELATQIRLNEGWQLAGSLSVTYSSGQYLMIQPIVRPFQSGGAVEGEKK